MASEDERTPLLHRIPSIVPPVTIQPGIEKLDSPVTISSDAMVPEAAFAKARLDGQKRKVPQCIAHRGYKAKFPENSMMSFREALKAGAQAIETDVHFTKDEVVVLSHDATLKRCFGRQDKILDLAWDEIKDLKTITEPHVRMPTFRELLEFLAQPENEHGWVLLDIKLDNDADDVMRLIAKTLSEVKPLPNRRWEDRVVLGIWAAKFLPFALEHAPGYPIVHIGASMSYARHFFSVPKIGFNMLLPMLLGPGGRKFIRECQEKEHRTIIAWTVNEEALMKWCIKQNLDGVITDDPAKFLKVRNDYDGNARIPIRIVIDVVRAWITITVMLFLFRRKLSPVASPGLIKKAER